MSPAVFVQANGLGLLFRSLIHLRMPSSSSVTLRCADRRSFRLVRPTAASLRMADLAPKL
jgi:hypothetical protein